MHAGTLDPLAKRPALWVDRDKRGLWCPTVRSHGRTVSASTLAGTSVAWRILDALLGFDSRRSTSASSRATAMPISAASGWSGFKIKNVLGWFPPGDTIYLDQGLDPENNLLAASIVVHEMVHILQFQAARTAADFSCARSIELERQTYGVQREFITRYGVRRPVGASMHQVGCDSP